MGLEDGRLTVTRCRLQRRHQPVEGSTLAEAQAHSEVNRRHGRLAVIPKGMEDSVGEDTRMCFTQKHGAGAVKEVQLKITHLAQVIFRMMMFQSEVCVLARQLQLILNNRCVETKFSEYA